MKLTIILLVTIIQDIFGFANSGTVESTGSGSGGIFGIGSVINFGSSGNVGTATTTTTSTTPTPTFPISALATGSASGYFRGLGSLPDQIAAIVNPQFYNESTTYFNSGNYAPQWLQLQLLNVYTIRKICLQVRQEPNGNTIHQLYAGITSNPTQLVTTLDGYTYDKQWLNLTYSPPLTNVRFLRLHTVTSPSWVAWIKFLIF